MTKKKYYQSIPVTKPFHLDFLNPSQELAWLAYQKHDLLFLLGCPGTGKSHLAAGFAVHNILKKQKSRIIITRPVVEAGESLGYLPGDVSEKIGPYMMPIYDCLERICSIDTRERSIINEAIEVVPLAFQRGRTFDDAVVILDEAQNCTKKQLKLALTRLGKNSKMIITGDPDQSDLEGPVALMEVVAKIGMLKGVGTVRFKECSIVRHSLVSEIVKLI